MRRYFPPGQSRFSPRQSTAIGTPGSPCISCVSLSLGIQLLACSTILVSRHFVVTFGALSLLCRRRLTLYLFLNILRRSRNIARCAIHRAGWRMFLFSSHAGCRLAATNRCGSGTRVLQVCGAAAGVARASHCAADTQDDDGATRENESFRVHLLLLCCRHARPGAAGRTENRSDCRRFRVAGEISLLSNQARKCLRRPQTKLRGHHAIIVHGNNGCIARDLPHVADSSSGKFRTWRTRIELRCLAGNADRKGTTRQEVDG